MSKSPLNDRDHAVEYVKRELRALAAENLDDGAAVFAVVSIDVITDDAMAEWDERMADPARAMPNGEPPNKAKEIKHAIGDAFERAFGWLDAREAAGRAGVAERTWTAYVARDQAPQHGRRNPLTGKKEWRAVVIGEWLENRPGSGTRTDLSHVTDA